tara:strand:+ start:312 stop:524 length:213 start_codon:yes stop_codon:yes gene_type:complete
MRVKNRRNLFRAIPVASKHQDSILTQQQEKEVDRSWKAFWKKRGFDKPLGVSPYLLGVFEMPSPKTYSNK